MWILTKQKEYVKKCVVSIIDNLITNHMEMILFITLLLERFDSFVKELSCFRRRCWGLFINFLD